MAEWTPDASEYLDGYLKQVQALARGAGEDGDEIASGLREHIIEKTECEAGPLVTLEVLRRALAEVGAPEAIVEDAAAWRTPPASQANARVAEHRLPPPTLPTPSREDVVPDRSGRFLRWSLGCVVMLVVGLIAVSVLSILAAVVIPAFARSREAARRAACQDNLKQIGLAIERWEKDHPNATAYPTKMSELHPKYIDEIRVFQCPVSQIVDSDPIDDWCAYAFNPDWSADKNMPIIIEKSTKNHVPGGRNALYNDGRVEFQKADARAITGASAEAVEAHPGSIEKAGDGKKEAILALQAIAHAEREILKLGRLDSDNDGTPDYGDLDDLDAETGEISTFGRHHVEGYAFHVELTPSSQPGGPSFVCRAIPLDESASAQSIAIGPDGVLRFLTIDEMKREQATQRV